MKKITFILSLVSLSLTVASASTSAQNENENTLLLPEFRVVTERYSEGEKSIRENLAALAASAQRPAVRVATELPCLGTVAQTERTAHGHTVATKPAATAHVRS